MDFRTKIQELIEQGKSFDEISKMFENEFNAAMAAASEENLDAMYEDALDALDAALQNDNMFTKDSVVNAAVCWAIEKHDDWGKDEIDLVKDTIATTLEIIEAGIKTLKPMLQQKARDMETDCACSCSCSDTDALRRFLDTL